MVAASAIVVMVLAEDMRAGLLILMGECAGMVEAAGQLAGGMSPRLDSGMRTQAI